MGIAAEDGMRREKVSFTSSCLTRLPVSGALARDALFTVCLSSS